MIRLPFGIKCGLSKRRKVPCIFMFERNLLSHQILHVIASSRWLKIIDKDDESQTIELYGQQLRLLNSCFLALVNEWRIWERYYLPNFSLDGKTVLDIGAGCGETAFFYLLNGAKKIVAIEPNGKAIECIEKNGEKNNWNVEAITDVFKLEHINIPHDFMKMDIEGHEKELLKVPYNKHCIVEVHSDEIRRKFEEKGFKTIYTYNKDNHLVFFTPKQNQHIRKERKH